MCAKQCEAGIKKRWVWGVHIGISLQCLQCGPRAQMGLVPSSGVGSLENTQTHVVFVVLCCCFVLLLLLLFCVMIFFVVVVLFYVGLENTQTNTCFQTHVPGGTRKSGKNRNTKQTCVFALRRVLVPSERRQKGPQKHVLSAAGLRKDTQRHVSFRGSS